MHTDNPTESPADFKVCHGDSTDTDELANAETDARSNASSFAADLAWMTFWSILMGGLLTASHWMWVLNHWDDATTAVPVGTVQRVLFIGNLGIDSQIDTEEHSFMVHGVTQLKKGSRIEQRKTMGSLQLCDADASPEHCEERMGYQ